MEAIYLVNASEGRLDRSSRRHGLIVRRTETIDGHAVVLYAYQRGFRPTELERRWQWAPFVILTARMAFLYLRYRMVYRGAWMVEVREAMSNVGLVEREVSNRASAVMAAESALDRIPSLGIAEVEQAFGVQAPPI